MEHIPKMVDMAMEQPSMDAMPEATNIKLTPQYPYGLTLCLNDDTLLKLNMDDDCDVGDHFRFHALGRITSKSDNEGSGKRIEIQIVAMSVNDSDNNDGESDSKISRGIKMDKMYK